jgi:hypothetical protein
MKNYNKNQILTYSYYDPRLRFFFHSDETFNLDDVTDFEDMSSDIYKTELLNLFNIQDIDSLTNDKLLSLEEFINNTDMKVVLTKMNALCENQGLCAHNSLAILLSYDYLFLTHKCICDLLCNKSSLKKSLDKLLNYIDLNSNK